MAEDFFGNLSKTLKKTVDTVGKKTDEFVEIQKIRITRISDRSSTTAI